MRVGRPARRPSRTMVVDHVGGQTDTAGLRQAQRALRPAARYIRQLSGTERITPIGARVSAVIPACAQINRYFSHRTRVMSGRDF